MIENNNENVEPEVKENQTETITPENMKPVEITANNVHEQRKKDKNLRIIIISVAAFIILLLAIIMIFIFYRKQKVYNFKDYKLYQYFSGVKVEYEGKVSITNDGEETKITTKDGVENIEDSPIYFKDNDNEVFFAKNMQLIIPRIKTTSYKINHFSKIKIDDDLAYLNYKNKNIYLEQSFLYDGDNLYFFIYETKVNIDEKEYTLSPLSYIIVNYKSEIEIYDKKEDNYTIIDEHQRDVIAYLDNYKVNLSTDSLTYDSGDRLLIKSPDNLPLYEGNKKSKK